jgi:hypothetical protein
MKRIIDFNINIDVLNFIDKICPEHWRTSCSDENINNWLFSRNELWYWRCARCNLLELASWSLVPNWMNEDKDSIWRFDW